LPVTSLFTGEEERKKQQNMNEEKMNKLHEQ
jgi:hypothetical protein